jgi:5-hydroxyisourate hydrolase-like protein (transthyretin family)
VGGASLALGFQAPPRPPVAQAPPAPLTPPAPGRGGIEGQVVNLATGMPLKRVNVRLVGIGRQQAGMPNMFAKESDDQGRFAFTGLSAGRYQITAERSGYLRQNYGARKYSTGGTPLVLGADQNVRDILFKLSPQSVITGKVLDEDGEPVANIQVRASKYVYRSGKKQWSQVGNGQTSDIGEFRIPNLDPGKYIVSAHPGNRGPNIMQTPSNEPLPQTAEMIFAATYYPSTPDSTNAVAIDVGPGSEMRGIDIRLRKTRVFRVRGTLTGVTGGRGQMMVMLSPKDGPQGPQNVGPARPPDNRFEIRGVSPGSYIVHTEPRGGPNQSGMAYQALQVTNHVDGVVLNVAPGMEISGSVKLEDAAAPIELTNVTVNLQPQIPIGPPPRAKADAGMKFTLRNVAPVRYRISVSGVPETCFVKAIRFGGVDVPEEGIDIVGAAPIDVILSATAGEISGAIVDKDGKPASNVLVALLPKDGKAMQSRTTDENGSVRFNALKPGDYRLIAFEDIPPGAHQDPDFIRPFEGGAAAVKLEPSGKQTVQVKLIPASETDK